MKCSSRKRCREIRLSRSRYSAERKLKKNKNPSENTDRRAASKETKKRKLREKIVISGDLTYRFDAVDWSYCLVRVWVCRKWWRCQHVNSSTTLTCFVQRSPCVRQTEIIWNKDLSDFSTHWAIESSHHLSNWRCSHMLMYYVSIASQHKENNSLFNVKLHSVGKE